MIKQINVSNLTNLKSHLQQASREGYTHVVPYNNDLTLYQAMLDAVKLDQRSIVVDYTIDEHYLNNCSYFGQTTIHFNDWVNNDYLMPNVIYLIDQAIDIINNYQIDALFDLALITLLQGNLAVDGHVVFNFNNQPTTSDTFWHSTVHELDMDDLTTQFYLDKIAYEHHYKVPFRQINMNDTNQLTKLDHKLLSTHFFMPGWFYRFSKQRTLNKHRKACGLYDKQYNQSNNHIVFLGDHYHYAGNSKYLFNYFVKHNPMVEAYFITDERRGPHFLSLDNSDTLEIIESARIVILENDLPNGVNANGTLIQLHQGTPIRQLFLDSKEPSNNANIPYYRAKRYNRWLQHDYIIHSVNDISRFYESAFPSHQATVLAYGNPKIQYLLQKQHDTSLRKQYRQSFKLTDDKPILFYAPIDTLSQEQLPLSDALFKTFHVIVQGIDEAILPEEAIVAPRQLSAQDLILLADVVLTDYSNIIFDAMTIDKKVCLYTPNHSEFVKEQGVNEEIWSHLTKIWYTDRQLLINNLIADAIPTLKYPQTEQTEQPLESISQLIHKIIKEPRT
ncbi:CDP-glycerol glycerophosphotransferase family protein [Staphylococcus simiae]|uniref:Uncharacterized protein n=1 Tax=Staphylococcus simiae CCM 7213 = CCUG 51256 TaxID=911238 RepID=G5JG21_9STAP|nr:CDP-glycerol glycerophosphotransferase family protein [Staphylococcus simiae]EHJ08853.1 hypothetical protein SS7213T_01928 [Staphylococcus simiae CCM 7213 = CCUG 51256]PNZ13348.1 CDP-glycerol--poly(glycerophosphate) glycerophosphotransferase [Staphylococcus simiae]SNV80556.1 Poly(glycerophosphate) glycerophosphotransferase family protein [Staphylococcus simiae]